MGLSCGQKRRASVSLTAATSGASALSPSVNSLPCRRATRKVRKYAGLTIWIARIGRAASGASGCPSTSTGENRTGCTGSAEHTAADRTPGMAATRFTTWS